jgi:hypothetical protein
MRSEPMPMRGEPMAPREPLPPRPEWDRHEPEPEPDRRRHPPPGEDDTAGLPRVRPDEPPDEPPFEEGEAVDLDIVIPISGFRSLLAAGFAAMLTAMLIFGSRLDVVAYAGVCFAIQMLFVVAWTVGGRPPAPRVVATAGIVGAAAADVAVVLSPGVSLAPLGYVVAGTFVVGMIGQLLRGQGRSRVTESVGSVAVVAVGVVALATPALLARYPVGTEAMFACMLAAGVALVVARVSDLVLRAPRVSPQVPRGAPGVVLGAMAGTAVAGWAGSMVMGLTPTVAAVAGLVVGMAALLADLGMVFAETGRLLAGGDPSRGTVRVLLGPLVALSVAAPAAYLLSVLVIVRTF